MGTNKNISIGVKWGIGLGLLYCALLYARWASAANIFAFVLITLCSYLLILGLLFAESAQRKKLDGGFTELKELFQTLFVTVLIFEAFYAIFTVIYLRAIDPTVIDKMKAAANVTMGKMGTSFTDEQKKSTVQGLEELRSYSQTGPAIKNYFTSVAVSGVLAFFIALIMRKRKPVVAETQIN